MTRFYCKTFLAGFLAALLLSGAGVALAATDMSGKINDALNKKDMEAIQSLLSSGPGNADMVLRALLKKTSATMATDPAFSSQMMTMAGQVSKQITPPSVPEVCAEMRRIVEKLNPQDVESDLFKSVIAASESLAKAPVVIAAGRPNQCELAWLDVADAAGDEALLAQMPSMRGPGLPPTTVRPGMPPSAPGPEDKPSAD
ncbi:MAG: hypothetical protein PHW63_01380 [Alphaproteobacteria bacterium]|nr:hypothetical protein [Alphaproteobacteria bacterium]